MGNQTECMKQHTTATVSTLASVIDPTFGGLPSTPPQKSVSDQFFVRSSLGTLISRWAQRTGTSGGHDMAGKQESRGENDLVIEPIKSPSDIWT